MEGIVYMERIRERGCNVENGKESTCLSGWWAQRKIEREIIMVVMMAVMAAFVRANSGMESSVRSRWTIRTSRTWLD